MTIRFDRLCEVVDFVKQKYFLFISFYFFARPKK